MYRLVQALSLALSLVAGCSPDAPPVAPRPAQPVRPPRQVAPRYVVGVAAPGRGTMELGELLLPVSEALSSIAGVKGVSLKVNAGKARFELMLDERAEVQAIRAAVEERVRVLKLPLGVTLTMNGELGRSVLWYGLAGEIPSDALRRLHDERVSKQVIRLPGVLGIDVCGGLARSVDVILDLSRLSALNLEISDALDALEDEIERPGQATLEAIPLWPLSSKTLVEDIATVKLSTSDDCQCRVDGRNAICGRVRAKELPDGLEEAINQARYGLASGLSLTILAPGAASRLSGVLRGASDASATVSGLLAGQAQVKNALVWQGQLSGLPLEGSTGALNLELVGAKGLTKEGASSSLAALSVSSLTWSDPGEPLLRLIITGPERARLGEAQTRLLEQLKKLPGVSVSTASIEERQVLRVGVDSARLVELGLDPMLVERLVSLMRGKLKIGQVKVGDHLQEASVSIGERQESALLRTPIAGTPERPIRLSDVVSTVRASEFTEISWYNGKPALWIDVYEISSETLEDKLATISNSISLDASIQLMIDL